MRNRQVGKNVKGHMIQNSTVKINTTIDEITNLVSQGRYEDVAKVLKTQESIIGVIHPKYPYYSLATKKN